VISAVHDRKTFSCEIPCVRSVPNKAIEPMHDQFESFANSGRRFDGRFTSRVNGLSSHRRCFPRQLGLAMIKIRGGAPTTPPKKQFGVGLPQIGERHYCGARRPWPGGIFCDSSAFSRPENVRAEGTMSCWNTLNTTCPSARCNFPEVILWRHFESVRARQNSAARPRVTADGSSIIINI
jgi:hypothetical protein